MLYWYPATEYHLGLLKAKLAKYRAQLLEPSKSAAGASKVSRHRELVVRVMQRNYVQNLSQLSTNMQCSHSVREKDLM